jgi:hypothetical protein
MSAVVITRGHLTEVPAGFAGRMPASLEEWEEASDDERAAAAYRIGRMYLESGIAVARIRKQGGSFWSLVADAMDAELGARQARAEFRAL